MNRIITSFAAMSLCAALVAPATAEIKVGDKMPALKVGQIYNNEYNVDLNDLDGHIVIVEFWATWCGPCKAQIPHINQMHNKYKDDGVLFISISDEKDSLVKPFVKQMKMEYLVASDSKMIKTFGVNSIPRCFLFSPDGVVDWTGHPGDLDKHLAEAVKKYPNARPLGGGPEFNERVFGDVEAALLKGDVRGAVRLFGRIDTKSLGEMEGHKARYAAIVNRITPMAQSRFERARQALAKEDYAVAGELLESVAKDFKGLPIAVKAAKELRTLESSAKYIASKRHTALERRAQNMLTRAQAQADDGEHVMAYRKLQVIVDKYSGTQAASEAQQLIAKYEADADFMKELEG